MEAVLTEAQDRNRQVARRINRETRSDPNSPYAGRYISILDGQVVAVADTLSDLNAQLAAMGSSADDAIWIEASADYQQTYQIWGLD